MSWRRLARIAALAGAYAIAGGLAAGLHAVDGIALIWPPIGIALAAVLLYGPELWPGVAIGALATAWFRGHGLSLGTAFAVGDVVEVVAIWYVLRRAVRIHTALDRGRDVLALLLASAVITMATAAIAVGPLAALGSAPAAPSTWSAWWWGHLGADVIVAPVVLAWGTRTSTPAVERRSRPLEVAALGLALVVVATAVFSDAFPAWLPGSREYLMVPVLLWTGVRFGPRGATVANLAVAAIVLVGSTLAVGPLRQLADAQIFVVISAMTTLMLSAISLERRRAVQRKSAILAGALDAIVTIDGDAKILELNPAAEQLFGYRERDVLGRDMADAMLPPAVRPAYRETLRRHGATAAPPISGKRIQLPFMRADGSEFLGEIAIAVAPLDGPMMFTGFVRDITAEHATEAERQQTNVLLERRVTERTAALSRVNAQLREAQALAHIGSFDLDVGRDHLAWSDELCRIAGRDAAALPASRAGLAAVIHADDRARVEAVLDDAIAVARTFGFEARFVRPSGEIRIVLVRGEVVTSADGMATRVGGVCQDITERKHAEEAGLRLANIVESSDDAVIGLALDGVIDSWNAAAERIFGYQAKDAIGWPLTTLVPPAEAAEVRRMLERARTGQHPAHYELPHVHRNGTHFDASVTLSVIVDRAGHLIGLSEVVRDITERTRADELVRASLREKEVLLREIHHRVKNNLQVISSLLSLQLDNEPSAAARAGLVESQQRIQAMALVHQLLYQSRDLASIDLGAYLKALGERLARAYELDDRIELVVEAQVVPLDIDRAIPCGLIANELITNAFRHGFPDARRGHVWVSVGRDRDGIALGVRDDGIGLPADVKLDTTHTFGLSIARVLADQIHGTLSVAGGAGTAITLALAG